MAYPLSYRHLEEMMEERGVSVDHSSINRWAVRFLPLIEKIARKHKRPVGGSWRMDETYMKVKGVWKYLYRAWFKNGHFGVTRAWRFRPVLIGNSREQCHAEGGLPSPLLVRLAGVELAPGRAA